MSDFDCCQPIGPDCRDGKHTACDGRAWDEHRDDTTACTCSCHAPEAAHAPTDDERWLNNLSYAATALEASADNGDRYCARLIREHLAAAGFRRSEVPEPSARELTPCGNLVCTGCRVCGCPALGIEPQSEPSDARRLVHEVNMLLSSVASHGPAALTDTSDRMYTPGLLRRLRDALDPKPGQRLAAGNAVRAEAKTSGGGNAQ